jgi:prophage regulatory protein
VKSLDLAAETGNAAEVTADQPDELLRSGHVRKMCADMPRSTMYALMAKKQFPRPVSLTGSRAVAWRKSDILRFIQSRTEKTVG